MAATHHATSNNAVTGALTFPQRSEWRKPAALDRGQLCLQKRLDSILKNIKSPAVGEAVQDVFISLSRLRDILRIVEINVDEEGPLPVTLATFSLVDNESKSLIRFIERDTSKIKSIKGPLRQALDGTSFALRHELKRVFGQDLARLSAERKANQVRAHIMRAHGLLSNCFQQSIIAIAQVFDPSVSVELLFDDYRIRLEQSTVLLRGLSSLVQLAREAEQRHDAEASDLLIRDLKAFCHGALHYLMYKDWEEFEDIAREVTSSYDSARHGFILHCFVTYLEALINQVGMRAVLNEQPLGLRTLKPAKKSRAGRR